jgi:hypothetical protein
MFLISFYCLAKMLMAFAGKGEGFQTWRRRQLLFLALGEWALYFSNWLQHEYVWMWISLALAVLWTYQWWKSRDKDDDGKRKKVLKEWGEKSKEAIRKMVDSITPSPIPSPVKS